MSASGGPHPVVAGLFLGLICLAGVASAGPLPYLFASASKSGDDLAQRFPPPPGAERVALAEGSFADYLRHLPLLPTGSPVLLYNGEPKSSQKVHAAVVDLDVGKRDLQQCADAVMRLRAEYLYAAGKPERIRFHPDPGKQRTLSFTGPGTGTGAHDRAAFTKYLTRVFIEAGSASLQAELVPVKQMPILPGDVLIQGGYPGHALLILDVAQGKDGRRYLLLGQSYMPAQQFHVVKNLGDVALSPWYDESALSAAGLRTPEWRPFFQRDVRRFPGD